MSPAARRHPLSRESVLSTAVALADEIGTTAFSTRKLAERLGVEAMALYHHFRNKDAILDGMVDLVYAEIELPAQTGDWQDAMRRRADSMRRTLIRHPWAISLLDSRKSPGPATLRHHDAVIGCLRAGGFSLTGAASAISLLDSYLYGFAIQELSLPYNTTEELSEVGASILDDLPGDLPHLAEMIRGYATTLDQQFDTGLDVILDGLHRRRKTWLSPAG